MATIDKQVESNSQARRRRGPGAAVPGDPGLQPGDGGRGGHGPGDAARRGGGRGGPRPRRPAAWAETPFAERAAVVRRFHDAILDASERALDTLQDETGKTRRDALAELVTVAGTARYYLAHGEGHLEDERRTSRRSPA